MRGERGASIASTAPKATPEQKKRGLELLQSAEAEAVGLEGGMRAYAFLQIARGYELSNKAKALDLLEDALTATRALQDDRSTRTRLQQQILQAMVPLAPSRADELLNQVEPESRENVLTALLSFYEKHKDWERALEVTYRAGQEKEIPYDAAQRIIEALPAERGSEAQQLFATALNSYREHKHEGFPVGPGDFGRLVVRSWKRMPPAMVEEAIDELLKQAAGSGGDSRPQNIAMASATGSVAFGSAYEYRLFQLLPVLKQIDESKAEKLLKDYQQVQTLLAKYPQGTQSLEPQGGERDRPGAGGGATYSIGRGSSGPGPGGGPRAAMPSPMEMQRMAKIVQDAEAHPQDALANAATLTNPDMRAQAYSSIARVTAKKNASVARSALEKQLEIASQLEPMQQIVSLGSAVESYLVLGQPDDARKVIERGFSAAEKLYKQDTDADNPNTALKAYWPSAEAWRSFLRLAGKISPVWALSLLKEIPDPEIKVASETALASAWLDLPPGQVVMMSNSKNNTRMMVMGEDRP